MYLDCVRAAGELYHYVEKRLRHALSPRAAGHAARGSEIVCGGIPPHGKIHRLTKVASHGHIAHTCFGANDGASPNTTVRMTGCPRGSAQPCISILKG